MVQIKFYKNASDINVLNKVLSNETVLECVLHDSTDLIRPSLVVKENILGFNYCYIPTFNRYYYIDNLQAVRNDLYRAVCRVDVLKTYANDILNSYGLIVKGKSYNPYYGNGFETEGRIEERKINFENPFNENGQYVLITTSAGDLDAEGGANNAN